MRGIAVSAAATCHNHPTPTPHMLLTILARAAAGGALRPAAVAACRCCTTTAHAAPSKQLVNTAQHQQQDSNTGSSSSSHARKIVLVGAGVAAAAVGGWAARNERASSAAALQRQQQLRDAAASLARAHPRAQAAASAALVSPLLHLLQGTSPSPAQLQGIAAALHAEQAAALGPLELADGLWGLALMQGSDASLAQQQHIASLAEAAVEGLAHMPLYEAIITVWAVTTLAGNLGSSSSTALSQRAWQQLQQRLENRQECVTSESAMLHLLHAAMQRAAAAAAAGGVSAARQQQQQVQPRASLAEVLEQCGDLPRRTQQRLAQTYQDYMPFYVEGPLLVLLHLASALPRYIAAAGQATAAASQAAAGAGAVSSAVGQGSGPGQQLQVVLPLVEIFGGLSPADAEAGAALMAGADPARLAKLKRELVIMWRSGELIDSHQRCVNEMACVCSHDMHLPVQTPPDADVLLPSLRAAVLVEGGERLAAGGATTLLALQNVSAAPPSPFTAAFWGQAHHCLAQLLRRRYAAPPAGFACRSSSGIAAARARMLRQRGWSVVTLAQADVEAALTNKAGPRVKVGQDAFDHRQLEALLRAALSASLSQ